MSPTELSLYMLPLPPNHSISCLSKSDLHPAGVWAKHQGVDLHSLLSPPTSHPPANPVDCAFKVHLESDHFSHSHVTTLIESTIISHLDSFRQPLPELPSSLPSLVTQLYPTLCNPMDCSMPRPPCPSPTPGVYPNSCPLSR